MAGRIACKTSCACVYPPLMDGNPAPATPDPGAYGPLAVRRMTKDDGRALIVYERVEEPSQSGSGEPKRGGARA